MDFGDALQLALSAGDDAFSTFDGHWEKWQHRTALRRRCGCCGAEPFSDVLMQDFTP